MVSLVATPTDHRHLCPRCGQPLARGNSSGALAWCMGWLFLRRYRCRTLCGFRGIRFSRSLFLKRKKRLRVVLVIVAFFITAGFTVRYVLSRSGAERSTPVDEGIGETD